MVHIIQYTAVEIEWHEELSEVARHIETWGYWIPKDQKLQMDQCLYVVFAYLLRFIDFKDACEYLDNMPPLQADIYDWKSRVGYWFDFLRLKSPRQRGDIADGILMNAELENDLGYCMALVPYRYFNEIVHQVLEDYRPRH